MGVWVSAVLLSCGGAAPPKAPPVSSAPSAAEAARTPTGREPSKALRSYWSLGSSPELVVFAERAGLAQPEAFSLLLQAAGVAGEQILQLPPAHRSCVRTVLERTRALVLGHDGVSQIVLLDVGVDGVKALRDACVGNVIPSERIVIEGAKEAYALGPFPIFVLEPEVVLIGEREALVPALTNGGAAWPEGVDLGSDEVARFRVDVPEGPISASGALRVAPQLFSLKAELGLPTHERAMELEQMVRAARGLTKSPEDPAQQAIFKQLSDAFSFERDGRAVRMGFELRASGEEQAKVLGAALGLAVYGTRQYVRSSKTAEARSSLAQIASAYEAYWINDAQTNPAKAKNRISALPAVPPKVPHGTKYQSQASDWAAWQLIGFSMDQPQYYQYEVVASKDGKSGAIVARGDLDGDGVLSEFRFEFVFDRETNALRVDPTLRESDPEE